MTLATLMREAFAAARTQVVATSLTVALVMGMIVVTMLTTGRSVAAEQAVLQSIDDAGSRTIRVRATEAAGITTSVLERIRHIDGVEWAVAVSSASDATNARIPDGARLPIRAVYGDLQGLGIRELRRPGREVAYASRQAMMMFGFIDGSGELAISSGANVVVGGELTVPSELSALEPLTLVARDVDDGMEPVGLVVVIADHPELVEPVSRAVLSVLGTDDPGGVEVETSQTLADVRGLVDARLRSYSRGLVLGTLVVTDALVAAILTGLALLRRKDFGRRRALGATRRDIIALVVTQTAFTTAAGITLGFAVSTALVLAFGDVLPGLAFTAALGVLVFVSTCAAALAPAVFASRRDPVIELRMP